MPAADIDGYRVPTAAAEFKLTVRGSKFLAWCAPIDRNLPPLRSRGGVRGGDSETAKSLIQSRSRLHHSATHNCWAYRIGPPDAMVEHSSDAGEPSGTAGQPILQRLQAAGLYDAVLVVSRWFGGTKLGRGGLIRAYGDAAQGVIDLLEIDIRIPEVTLQVECRYDLIGAVEAALGRCGGKVTRGDYGETARLEVTLPLATREDFLARIQDAGAGRIEVG